MHTQQTCNWAELDDDILVQILSKVAKFPGQLAHCRLVCTTWRSAAGFIERPAVTALSCANLVLMCPCYAALWLNVAEVHC